LTGEVLGRTVSAAMKFSSSVLKRKVGVKTGALRARSVVSSRAASSPPT